MKHNSQAEALIQFVQFYSACIRDIQSCLCMSDGYAPFMSLSDRDTMLVNESLLAAPGPGQYDPRIPQDTVKVFWI